VRVAVYGGSFDPPHVGHALVAGWLLWTRRVDRVWLVPAFSHAFDKELAPFERRVALCEALAADVDARIEVRAIERDLPTPSFTLNTLRALAQRHPRHRLRLVVGADVLEQLDHWHRWDRIEADFEPIVVGRQGWPAVPGAPLFPGVSSSEIRGLLARSEPVDHLVTASVAELLRAGAAR